MIPTSIFRRRWLSRTAALAAWSTVVVPYGAHSQTYPWKPVRIVVPWAPGGLVDTGGRLVADALTRAFGQPAPVENIPGAAGTLGADQVAKAAADGHTLLMGTSSIAIDVAGGRRLPYDPRGDLVPVALVADTPSIIIVPAASPIRSVAALVQAAKADPGGLSYGTPGIGSPAHLFVELFAQTAGVELLHVPYGRVQAINDLIGERLSMMIATAPAALPHIRNGLVRPLAVTSAGRLPALPDVPTVTEDGLPGYEAGQWLGVFAPAGTPALVVQRLNSELARTLATPETVETLQRRGLEPKTATPEAFSRLFTADVEKWSKVMVAANIKLQ